MQGKNKLYFRYLENHIRELILDGYSCLIMGPRQVGKTTLVKECLNSVENKIEYWLQNPSVRLDLEAHPGKIIGQIEAQKRQNLYVFIDEAQKIPQIFDSIQYLIDNKKAHFILTGSSARKLRRSGANLLPGRIKKFSLDPLLLGETGLLRENTIEPISIKNINSGGNYTITDCMLYGSLPGIATLPEKDRSDFLRGYVETYLEEEIRAESLSRKIGAFSRFLELAAAESGTSPNFTKLSNETGISQPAVKEYYNLLNDTLIVERLDSFTRNSRKRILSSSRYYFFDIGVRNAASRLPMVKEMINSQKGILFEHVVILEIIRRIRALRKNYRVYYWRTSGGAEVDCIIDMGEEIIPIEIKSSESVSISELRGLRIFLKDYKNIAREGYVVTMGKNKEKLSENITAVPWQDL